LKTHGNEYARKVWLGNAPNIGEGGRPREGDDINVFKRFVVDVYEKKRYYVEPVDGDSYEAGASSGSGGSARPTSGVGTAGRTITSHKPNVALQQGVFNSVPVAAVRPPQPVAPAPVQAAAPAVDLLDFGAFDTAPPATAAPATATPANHLFDPFNTNPPATSAPAPAAAIQTVAVSQNGFGQDASFDHFGTMSSTQSVRSSAVPIMNNNFGMQNNAMGGMNSMSGMQNGGMMRNNAIMQNNPMHQNNMMGMNNMMMSNNMGMANNNTMMQNQMHSNMMMPNQMNTMNGINNFTHNSMMGTPNTNSGMSNTMMPNQMNTMNGINNFTNNTNSGMHKILPAAPQLAMNMNIMQPMSNSISNNFGSKPAAPADSKKDPFAGLGF
jgi:hypothetical protein